MTNDKILQFQSGFNTAFINSNTNSNLAYRPQFIYNNNKDGQKVFSAIEDELCKCDSFTISVAFITRGGITPLLQTLKELERRGIPGRILTTDYLTFSDPVALDTLAGLSNVELRMYQTERAGNGFHTKSLISCGIQWNLRKLMMNLFRIIEENIKKSNCLIKWLQSKRKLQKIRKFLLLSHIPYNRIRCKEHLFIIYWSLEIKVWTRHC